MISNIFRIAGLNIRIVSVYGYAQELCRDYMIYTGQPDIEIFIKEEDIDNEIALQDRTEHESIKTKISRPYYESLAVYRKIAENIVAFDAFLIHGSCIAVDNKAYLFTAPCSTGKSTHTYLWRMLLKDRAVMVNDDKPIIRFCEGIPTVFGTPWNGKHRIGSNISVPLKAVCMIERSEANGISRVNAGDSFLSLVQQTYRPMEPEKVIRTLDMINALLKTVDIWKLRCNMSIEAASVAYDAMKG